MPQSDVISYPILRESAIVSRVMYIFIYLVSKDSSGDWIISEADITWLKETLNYRKKFTKYDSSSPWAKNIVELTSKGGRKFKIARTDFDRCIVAKDDDAKTVWGELGGCIRPIYADLLPTVKEMQGTVDTEIFLELLDRDAIKEHRIFLAKSAISKFGVDLSNREWLPVKGDLCRGRSNCHRYYNHGDSLFCCLLIEDHNISFALASCILASSVRQDTDPGTMHDLDGGLCRGPRRGGALPRYV